MVETVVNCLLSTSATASWPNCLLKLTSTLRLVPSPLFALAAFLGVLWSTYDAVYPPESFYATKLQHLVQVTLPPEAQFLYKTASYPDIHGDYSACFIVRLPANALEKLKTSIASEPVHETKSSGCANMEKTLKPLNVMANQYSLSNRATREDAGVVIELIPTQNLAVISWYTW